MIGLAAMLAFLAALVVGNYARTASLKTPFGWQDEGYVLGPALKVYEGGWKNYRCRGDQIVCYGAVHTFFDVLVLRALPKSWVEEASLMGPPGPEWFYQSKFPNAFVALRVFRVVLAVFLLGLVALVVARAKVSWWPGVLVALALPSFEAFRSSRMGLKNDFSFSLYLVFFLLLANEALHSNSERKSRDRFFFAVLVGVAGISVKFGIILPLVLLFPAYLVSALFRGRPRLLIFYDLAFGGLLGVFAVLATNPGLTVSLGEANWFSSFLSATARRPSGAERAAEFYRAILPNLWPLPVLVAGLISTFRTSNYREKTKWIYLVGVPLVWVILTWKSAFLRPAYYLPILVWVGVVYGWVPRLNRYLLGIATALLVFQIIPAITSEVSVWHSFSNLRISSSVREPWALFGCGESGCEVRRWVVDRTTRAAVPRDLGEANVLYFDSFVDSPLDLKSMIRKKWPDSGGDRARMLATCWASPAARDSDPTEFYSPAAEAWAKILSECPNSHPITANAAFAFENGWRPSSFQVVEFSDFRAKTLASGVVKGPLSAARDGLSPRMLSGAWRGIDSWYSPVILNSSASLEGEFRFPNGLSEAALPFESTCKGGEEVEFAVGDKKRRFSADTRALLCEKRPWVCRFKLEDWWTERFPLGPVVIPLIVPRGGSARLRIFVKGGDPDRCRISLGNIRFTPAEMGTKVVR